jgi:hypothetical protein
MTRDERRIANAALGAGPWENHDQIVIAVAHVLGLEAQLVEAVMQRLRIRMVLVCVSAASAGSEGAASVRYERGVDWMDGLDGWGVRIWASAALLNCAYPPTFSVSRDRNKRTAIRCCDARIKRRVIVWSCYSARYASKQTM